jgi:hypothetical protein
MSIMKILLLFFWNLCFLKERCEEYTVLSSYVELFVRCTCIPFVLARSVSQQETSEKETSGKLISLYLGRRQINSFRISVD